MPSTPVQHVRLTLSSSVRSSVPLSLSQLQALAEVAQASVSRAPAFCVVDVRFVGDTRIRSLNLRWRKKDKVTDVLSFPQLESADSSVHFPKEKEGETLLGDLVLCVPQARRQAHKKGVSLRQELAWMFVHGFLHLLGLDHQTDTDEAHMETIERRVLTEALGI